jgi:DNA-directed RNA polymerase specialized sigma24 family protein
MTLQEPSREPDPIVDLVLQCQHEYIMWKAEHDQGQAELLGAKCRQSLEALLNLLFDDLRYAARGWLRSNIASDPETLALNMFANIVFQLPKLHIDPQRPVRNLLITVARRGLIDEYRRTYSNGPRRQSSSSSQDIPPQTGTPDARMWQTPGDLTNQSSSLDAHTELSDQKAEAVEDGIVSRISGQSILQAVWEYWQRNYSGFDLQIMQLRWQMEPPRTFMEIATRLGPGWLEATVRQRHKRIMDATRKYLREQGLIDDNSMVESMT